MTTEIAPNGAQGCRCWVQITQELRDYAQKHQIDEGQAAEVSAQLCLHQIFSHFSASLGRHKATLALLAPDKDFTFCVLHFWSEQLTCCEMLPHAALCALQAGMAQMSEQFKSVGAEVYLDEATVEVNA